MELELDLDLDLAQCRTIGNKVQAAMRNQSDVYDDGVDENGEAIHKSEEEEEERETGKSEEGEKEERERVA